MQKAQEKESTRLLGAQYNHLQWEFIQYSQVCKWGAKLFKLWAAGC